MNAEEGVKQSAEKEVGIEHIQAFDLPASSFLAPAACSAARRRAKDLNDALKTCPFDKENPFEEKSVLAFRECFARYCPSLIARHRELYKVRIQPETIAGICTEIITPEEGVAPQRRARVLINLHGGGFVGGARYAGQVESIPIAAVGKIKVVSVDYRMAPEHSFPAASQDVTAVYRDLLKDYKPENIGIYGCSAGAVLTAQAVAWIQKERLPRPGAIAMLCGAGSYWSEGDSGHFVAALSNTRRDTSERHPYFKGVDLDDPLVFPARSAQTLASFPPSLLITSIRDQALSSVAYTHSVLVEQGVEADLHVWEGLGHAFFNEPDFPESRAVHEVTARFFDRHLGKQR